MPDYTKTIIYMIKSKNEDDDNVYIGSTKDFKQRMRLHKSKCNNEKDRSYNYFIYQYIRQNGGWDSFQCDIIHEFDYEDDKHKRKIEQEYINKFGKGLNSDKAYQPLERRDYLKQYQIDNKEKITEQKKIKITCECGTSYTKNHKTRHEKSNKHIKFIKSE